MRYKIKKIESQDDKWEIIIIVALIMLYFIFFALSEAYDNYIFPDWILETHKKLPK